MLRQRVVTAVLLLLVLVPALGAAVRWPFIVFTLVMVSCAAWEWFRLCGVTTNASLWAGSAMGALGLVAWRADTLELDSHAAILAASVGWLFGGAWVLHQGVAAWGRWPRRSRLALGLLVLAVAWLSMCKARALGLNFILSVFCLVWCADVAAYAGGRLWGRRKLAVSISPGKTWEGALTGWFAVLVLGIAWVFWVDTTWQGHGTSVYACLLSAWGWVGFVGALTLLTALAVMGDLFESLVKRQAGVKDSSGLLPGHGGVLDRIDALLPVFPAALALCR